MRAFVSTDSVLITVAVEDPPITELTIWNVILSFKASFDLFLEYLKVQLGVGVENYNVGSLLITVTCSSLQILEGLWEAYSSGRLDTVAKKTLVTAQVLATLGVHEVKLKTTITKHEYRKCKEFFLGTDQVRPAHNLHALLSNFYK